MRRHDVTSHSGTPIASAEPGERLETAGWPGTRDTSPPRRNSELHLGPAAPSETGALDRELERSRRTPPSRARELGADAVGCSTRRAGWYAGASTSAPGARSPPKPRTSRTRGGWIDRRCGRSPAGAADRLCWTPASRRGGSAGDVPGNRSGEPVHRSRAATLFERSRSLPAAPAEDRKPRGAAGDRRIELRPHGMAGSRHRPA